MQPTLFIRAAAIATLSCASAWAAGRDLDFDGDNVADLAVFHAEAGNWYIRQSGANGALKLQNWGWNQTRPVLGDFDGDGKADIAVYHAQAGVWYIQESSSGNLRQTTYASSTGRAVPGDYDGDGKTDLAFYRRESGEWRILQSSNGLQVNRQFGFSEARPVPGDFDNDGKTDLAVYHRATGNWYIQTSSNGGVVVINWGWSQARPVVGDYDGDGVDDLAVYHLATGDWYIRQSGSNGALRKQNWGWIGARATPGDFDGDGRTDLAVYHRDTGNWYIQRSSNNALWLQNWGWINAGAVPAYRDGGIMGLVVLSFGDSITYGTSSSTESPLTGYPILLERKLEPALGGHFVSINGGNPGESTEEGKERIKQWLDLFKPDLTLIMEGTNDMFFKVPFDTVQANLSSMISSALTRGSAAIIATIPPVIKSAYRDRTEQEKLIEQFNPRIYSIASSYGISVARVWESITSVPGWETKLMDQETANHPNDAGYLVVRDAFYVPVEQGVRRGAYY